MWTIFPRANKLSETRQRDISSAVPCSSASSINGLLEAKQIEQRYRAIQSLDVERYSKEILQPADDLNRPSAWQFIQSIAQTVEDASYHGSLVLARVTIADPDSASRQLKLAVIVQNRAIQNGVWMPEQHLRVEKWLQQIEEEGMPVLTLIDTPGASAGDQANLALQAHTISRLITRFTALEVPSVGLIFGKGYSGGAIPLAATNVLLALKDAVFNTIQPQGLAAIARKEKLTWQECARHIGIGAIELAHDGIIDGIIDYSPLDGLSAKDAQARVSRALLDAFNKLTAKRNKGESMRTDRWQVLRGRLGFLEATIQAERRLAWRRITKSSSLQNYLGICQARLSTASIRSRRLTIHPIRQRKIL